MYSLEYNRIKNKLVEQSFTYIVLTCVKQPNAENKNYCYSWHENQLRSKSNHGYHAAWCQLRANVCRADLLVTSHSIASYYAADVLRGSIPVVQRGVLPAWRLGPVSSQSQSHRQKYFIHYLNYLNVFTDTYD